MTTPSDAGERIAPLDISKNERHPAGHMRSLQSLRWSKGMTKKLHDNLQGHFPINRFSSPALTAPCTLRHISILAMSPAIQAITTARKPLPFPIFHLLVPSSIGAAYQHVSTETP